MVLFYGSLLLGSSPPVRGAHGDRDTRKHHGGLIPARAGSTHSVSQVYKMTWAHPRPCGEHAVPSTAHPSCGGSSPPVRGAQHTSDEELLKFGLIPARAGSTSGTRRWYLPPGAHPRPCGEHSLLQMRSLLHLGSSPPVRGAQHVHIPEPAPRGLIPARAGSTVGCTGGRVCRWAHPRPCGEHESARVAEWVEPGSSPPVRGALQEINAPHAYRGLIPARAGSTSAASRTVARHRAHPRPCGEHGRLAPPQHASAGSSPPVRGAPYHRNRHLVCCGLIPARAGSTALSSRILKSAGAHPRPCGEHLEAMRKPRGL